MSRFRDQKILSYAAGRVWATDPETRNVLVSILTRHYQGGRLSEAELADIRSASPARQKPSGSGGGQVAVLPLWGPLVPHAGMMVDLSTEGTGLDQWARDFQSIVDDPNVSTVVLRVHSPGGSAQGVTEAAKVIRDARQSKRIVAVADGLAASAAFCLASQADEFYVTPSGFVGAVHCYTVHEDISQMLERDGVKLTLVGAPNEGEAEAMEFLPLSDANLAHMQAMVDQFYGRFVSDVAKGRGVSEGEVRASYGGGRVLTSQDAYAAGMVDGIRSFDEVLAKLSGRRSSGTAVGAAAHAGGISVAAMTGSNEAISGPMLLPLVLPTVAAAAARESTHEGSPARPAGVEATGSGGATQTGGTTMSTTDTDRPATLEELAARRDELHQQMQDLNGEFEGRQFSPEAQQRFDGLLEEHTAVVETIDNINQRKAILASVEGSTPAAVVPVEGGRRAVHTNVDTRRNIPDNVYDMAAYRGYAQTVDELPKLWKEGALRVNESARYMTQKRERVQGFVEQLLDQDSPEKASDSFALRILGAANPLYEEAFAAKLAKRPLTPAQEGAFRMAVSNNGLGSESPVPITIDPTLLLDSDGATNPLRRLARNVAITGNTWQGLASQGVSFAYSAELAAVDPVTPTFRGPKAEVVRAIAEIQGSWEVFADWPSLRAELAMILADAKNVAEADKFLTGDGDDEPEGLIWALDDDGTSKVETATTNTLTLDDAEGITFEIPQRFDESASWLANKAFYGEMRSQAREANGSDVLVPLPLGFQSPGNGSLPYTMFGYGCSSGSEVSKEFTTGGEIVAVLGDYQRGFVIVDRIGMNVLFDEIVRDGNGKVIGAAAVIAVVRNTSKLLSANAFRYLQIKGS